MELAPAVRGMSRGQSRSSMLDTADGTLTLSYKCLVLYDHQDNEPSYCHAVVSSIKFGLFACLNHPSYCVLYFEADRRAF